MADSAQADACAGAANGEAPVSPRRDCDRGELYALSKAVALDEPKADDRGSLLAGMEGRILAMSSLRAVDTSRGSEGQQSGAASQGRKPERRPQQP